MDASERLLREIVELQKASIRLQRLSISLQAEAIAYRSFAATQGRPDPRLERRVMRSVREIRATMDRVEKGKALPK